MAVTHRVARRALPHEEPVMCWAPGASTFVHAARPGANRSLCGRPVQRTGPPWPATDGLWPCEHTRCPACAGAVYGVDRR